MVTVTHNSSHLIDIFLSDLLRDDPDKSDKVVVVDSGSPDSESTRKSVEAVGAHFVASRENIGYGSASNLGSRSADSDWIALVNPDVRVSFADVEKLVAEAVQYNIQCIGPNVHNEHQELQTSWHTIASPPWRKQGKLATRRGDFFLADSVSGCCMVINRGWFEKLGGFDESFFMFCEEIDLHKRLVEAGGRVGISNRVAVQTPGGGSSLGTTKRWSMVERDVAHVQFTTKHYSRLEGSLDAVWRLVIILTKPNYRPRTVSLRQFAVGLWTRVVNRRKKAAAPTAAPCRVDDRSSE